MLIAHQVLVGAGLPCRDLEVVPSEEQKQEEGQHEELPMPHRHQEDLRGRDGGDTTALTQSPSRCSHGSSFLISAGWMAEQNM